MTFKEQLKQELANTRKVTLKDVGLRVKHRFKFFVVFAFISYVVLKTSIIFWTISTNEYLHIRLCLLVGFFCAVVFLPEEKRKSDN